MERRSHDRFAAKLKVTVHAVAQPGSLWHATCTNLGLGGGYLEGGALPAPGTRVEVAVGALDSKNVLVLQATVAYLVRAGGRRPAGIGVAWLAPDWMRLNGLVSRVANDAVELTQVDKQTAEFDFGQIGSEGRGVTRKYPAHGQTAPQADAPVGP